MPGNPCPEYTDLLFDVTERGWGGPEEEAVRVGCLIDYVSKFQAVPIWTEEDEETR